MARKQEIKGGYTVADDARQATADDICLALLGMSAEELRQAFLKNENGEYDSWRLKEGG